VSSSTAGEPPRKRSKTAAADVDVMEKVSYISVLSHLMRLNNTGQIQNSLLLTSSED
jgi:hypothetical protein